MKSPMTTSSRRGFSLIELLVVVAVIGLVIALSGSALMDVARGQGMKRAIADVGGLLEQGRAEAMASSTWTWVGLKQQTSGPETELVAVLVASKDGSTNRADNNLRIVSKPLRIKNVQILGQLSKWANGIDGIKQTSDGNFGFSQKVRGENLNFAGNVVGFTPRGEAAIDQTSVPTWIEIGLQETRGLTPITNKTASLRVSGFSGQLNTDY